MVGNLSGNSSSLEKSRNKSFGHYKWEISFCVVGYFFIFFFNSFKRMGREKKIKKKI